jgi:hypothetical protein
MMADPLQALSKSGRGKSGVVQGKRPILLSVIDFAIHSVYMLTFDGCMYLVDG